MNTKHKTSSSMSQLAPYKIGLALIGLIAFIVLIATIAQAGAVRQDHHVYQQTTKIADRLNSYIDDKQTIPESLAAANINDTPDAITYQKLSAQRYKFCVRYRTTNTGGFSQTVFSSIYGDKYENGMADSTYEAATLYLEPYYHKGLNCQTIKPSFSNTSSSAAAATVKPAFTKNADGSYTVCGVHTNYFDGEGHVLQGPPTTPGSISISSTAYPYTGDRLLFMISSSSQVFDESCNHLVSTDMQVGNTVAVFDITSPTSSATSIFLKRAY